MIYATTEPGEALLLGGYTAVLDEGRLLQYGPTAEVFHRPSSIRVARAFSDPPMNLFAARAGRLRAAGRVRVERPLPAGAGDITAGLRAGALDVHEQPGHIALDSVVKLAEISGSDTFVHAETAAGEVVAQLPGVHRCTLDQRLRLYFDPAQTYAFGADGACWQRRAGCRLPSRRRPADGADRAGPLPFLRAPSPGRRGLRAAAAEVHVPRWRRLRLLGPSGCGKTTLLNCVSGLLRPSHGRILFDGQDVTAKTPQARNIAQVFQFPVVYDTMTVAENLAFPLRNRGIAPDRIRERVGRIAEMLEMSQVLDRRASG